MTFTPANLVANRTARLVREATTPVFTSTREGQAQRERTRMLIAADNCAGEEFCFICSRATDHRGEHSDDQLEAFARSHRGRSLMGTW